MGRGKFIVFEGLDGSGSSTHSKLINKKLKDEGIDCVPTKEPTNNIIGGVIRGILTSEWTLPPHGLQLLFSADRAHHLERLIEPTLKKGTNVICDRYMYSTIAYGSSEFNDKSWLEEINKFFRVPDLVILLKVRPEECIRRIGTGRVEFELFEKTEKLRAIWAEYEKLAKNNSFFKIVDGERDREEVAKEVYQYVKEII